MDVHQEIKNTDEVTKYSFVHFEQQADGPDDKIQTELTNTTGPQLQHMNEDCLLEIFSSKSLTPMDLCSLAETCTRFEQITQRVFPKEFFIKVEGEDGFYNDFKSKNYFGGKKGAHDVERIFKNFGSCLSAFSFRGFDKEDVLHLLPKYCVGTLEKLKICSEKISEVLAVKLKPIFQQLQQLNLHFVTIEVDANVFVNCDSLTEFKITEVKNAYTILENIFPKLERFQFRYYYEENGEVHKFDYEHFLSVFISRHKSLKTFILVIDDIHIMNRILKTIGNNCKELEELEISESGRRSYESWGRIDFSDLHDLHQLKQLTFSVHSSNVTNCILQLQPLKSLETLKIRQLDGFDEEYIPALALLTNLRELYLPSGLGQKDSHHLALLTQLKKLYVYSYFTITNAVDIIRRMTNLEELTIDYYHFVLCEKSFSEIVQIVKGRPRVLTLRCEFDFFYNLKNCDENQNVKLIKIERR